MRELGNYLRAGKARSFARAVALLCLVGHASFVTITHHHGETQSVSTITPCSVELNTGSGPSGPPETSNDKCCPSCCLQRNFVTSIQPNSILPDLCPEQVRAELFIAEPSSKGLFLVLSDRAPPLN